MISAMVHLPLSIPDKSAIKQMWHRCSASSEISLPALSSEQILQDNRGFVCFAAARPLRIEQNGENQNQVVEENRTNQLSSFCHRYQCFFFFTSFIPRLHPFPSFCLHSKESTFGSCQTSTPSIGFLPVSLASLKRSLVLNY